MAFAANAGADLGMHVESGDSNQKRKQRSSSGRPPSRVPALVGNSNAGAATPADPVQPPLKKRREGPP